MLTWSVSGVPVLELLLMNTQVNGQAGNIESHSTLSYDGLNTTANYTA